MPTSTAPPATTTFQGIEVPSESVNPGLFQAMTRRKTSVDKAGTFAGLGFTDQIPLRKADLIAGIWVRLTGSVTITGTPDSTMNWPYGLLKRARFSANTATGLIDCSGHALKAREFMAGTRSDRGVSQTVGSTAHTQGTFSQNSEAWGIDANATLSAGTYDFDVIWPIPVTDSKADLSGAIFAQTTTTDLNLDLSWADASDLVSTAADISVSGKYQVIVERYSLPTVNGLLIVPDLSIYHGMVQNTNSAIANGAQEVPLAGQGAGVTLLRTFYRVLSGSTPVPLAVNATNYGEQSWTYSSNTSPEVYPDGAALRQINEQTYNCDIGAVWGWLAHEFAITNAFRDVVDEGQTSQLRLGITIPSGVSLTSPVCEYVQETIFPAGG